MSTPSPRLSSTSPARVAAYLALLIGLALVGYAVVALSRVPRPPLPYCVALLIAGAVELGLAPLLLRRRRAAWAFAASLNGTAFLVFVFGAFEIRDAGVPVALAFVPALLFGTVTTLLAVSYEEFESRT